MNIDIQSKVTAILAQHSRKITLAAGSVLLGSLLLITISWLANLILAPSVPDMRVASATQVAEFMANPRGFTRMPITDRRQMLFDIWNSGPDMNEHLADEFARLPSDGRDQVRIAAMKLAMDQLERAARTYRQLGPKDRDRFVGEFIESIEELREQLRGIGDAFKDNLPTKSDEWTKSLVTQTTARQRARVKPFVDHVVRVAEQRKGSRSKPGKGRRRSRNG